MMKLTNREVITIIATIKRGDIYYADLSPAVGSEQGGVRPVVIIQNDIGNKFSPTTIAVPMTSRCKNKLPTHVEIKQGQIAGLHKDSVILGEQIQTIDKRRLKEKIGELNTTHIIYLNQALLASLSIVQ